MRGILIAGGVLMILTGLAAIHLGRRLAEPILALAGAASAVERLDLESVPALPRSTPLPKLAYLSTGKP